MALSKARIVSWGETPYAHEQDGLKFAVNALPDTDPYHAWALVDLLDPSTGRLLEIDLLVLGFSCLYLVELKANPGRIEGDSVDWTWITPEGRRLWRDNPRTLARRKAQILKSRLERKLPGGVRAPWVEPLVFLTDPNVNVALAPEGRIGVVTRHDFAHAISHHEFPGADPRHQGARINMPTQRAVVQALAALGFRPRKGKFFVGSYELGTLLGETDSYQDREAVHRDLPAQKRRARTYLVPDQTSVERRQQLRRAADREAQLLYEVREHPNVLTYMEYVTDAPLGPTVLFDAFDDGIPLDAFLRRYPDLPFLHRIAILEAVGWALDHCHRKRVIHGGLSPSAVLVRRAPGDGPPEVRLHNFQLGASGSVEPTSHRSVLIDEQAQLYLEPEVRKGNRSPDPQGDLFGLGALGYLLLTGQPPARTPRELEEKLAIGRCLDPRDVANDVRGDISELIAFATHEVLSQRADHAGAWLELLLDRLTAADVVEKIDPDRSPLEALPRETVGEFEVIAILGHGASARVLEVERHDDERHFALKVSLGPDHDTRLRAEATTLNRLRHPRIVQLEGELTLAGRPCLLLSLAGRSLQRELAEKGALSLDYASRYGADLLGALEHLEEKDVLHRDLKPANVGVGAVSKKMASLTIFDFSLATTDVRDLGVGTAAYRDPFLADRGRWDAAADRYSAAVILHEIMTGQRPEPSTAGAPVRVAAERFDPTVRAGLTRFFQTALAREVGKRHPSAEKMRLEWERVFGASGGAELEPDGQDAGGETVPDVAIAAIAPGVAIEALPLSNRAKNALDRAGVNMARDLLALPQNRLSAVRGVGQQVADEIHRFRTRWTALAKIDPGSGEPAFFPAYRGDDLLVGTAGLSVASVELLGDAGFRTLSQVAAAPATHVGHLIRKGLDEAALRALLSREHERAEERAHPTTIGTFVEALLGARKKRNQHPRALFGLDGPLAGRIGTSPRELAEALGLTPAAIYIALGKVKPDWAAHPAIDALSIEVHALVDQAGGALPLGRAGEELCARIPATGEGDATVAAAALVRVVIEVEKDDASGLRLARLDGDAPWVAVSEEVAAQVHELGAAADELADRPILVGPTEAFRHLVQVVEGTPLADLPQDRLVRLAASASQRAAVSSRLELHPKGLEAARALELSSAVLPPVLTDEEARARVAGRYPGALPLPSGPALEELLRAHGYEQVDGTFRRKDGESRTQLATSATSHMRSAAGRPGPEIAAAEVAIADFDSRLRTTLEQRSLLVLGVAADRAVEAERALAARHGLVPRSFDALFLQELDRQIEKHRVDPELVYRTDGAGRTADGWTNLRRLAERTAKAIEDEILPPRTPLLLTQPGLIDRYQLVAFLRALLRAADHDDAAAILLLVPGHDRGKPMIGDTSIPDLLPGQSVWIPRPWLKAGGAVKVA